MISPSIVQNLNQYTNILKSAETMDIITLESLQILVYSVKVSSCVLLLRAGYGLAEFNRQVAQVQASDRFSGSILIAFQILSHPAIALSLFSFRSFWRACRNFSAACQYSFGFPTHISQACFRF